MNDPLQVVWDALEAHGCRPRGQPWKGTALCPSHEDSEPSLSIGVGADGRALICCHAGCDTRNVVAALGLTWTDLFPAGHRHARPLRGVAKARRPIDLVLAAVRELGIDYRATRSASLWVVARCPACGADERWPLWVVEEDEDRRPGRVCLCCLNGCEQVAVLVALAGVAP
jgi:hypothetical protein